MKVENLHIIEAYNGVMVLDATPEAAARIAAMDYLEDRYARERKARAMRMRKFARNPFYRLACFCGLV